MKILCIGGPADGLRFETPERVPILAMSPRLHCRGFGQVQVGDEGDAYPNTALYSASVVIGDTCIYTHFGESQQKDAVLAALVAGYRVTSPS